MDTSLFKTDVALNLTVDDKILYTLEGASSHLFTATPVKSVTDSEDEEPSIKIPFIITTKGIRLAKPFETNNLSIQMFKLSEDKRSLIETDNPSVKIIPEPISDFIVKTSIKYFATKDSLGGIFSTVFDKLAEEFTSVYKGKRNLVSVGFRIQGDNFYFLLKMVNNEAAFRIPYTIGDNTITIEPFDGSNMSNADMDNNARLFYAAVSSIKEILNTIQGTYDLTSEEPFVLNTIKYTKRGKGMDYLIVKR
jgi:hypothetical protein